MYIIPANSKKGQLIFNLFEPIDLIILSIGVFSSFIFLVAIPGEGIWELALKILPAAIASILVFPVAYYHNGRVFFKELYIFLTSQNKYIWRGWCYWYEPETKKK